ncbi:MAG: PilZ domain-containing protein [Pseudomonadota bacterium]
MSVTQAKPVQRRRADRQRSLLAGKLTNEDASITVDCTIRDLSETGALIELAAPEMLPRALRLMQIREGVLWDVEVAWRRGRRMGLILGERHDLRTSVEPELRALRAIWSHMAPR